MLGSHKIVAFVGIRGPDRAKALSRYTWSPPGKTAPSGARVAWFKDPGGNVLSMTKL